MPPVETPKPLPPVVNAALRSWLRLTKTSRIRLSLCKATAPAVRHGAFFMPLEACGYF